jgi:penicillin-binding protein 2
MQDLTSRKEVIIVIFVTICIIFLGRLFYIQIVDDSYKLSADNNVLRYVTQHPSRGLIFDRNGKVLVYNQAAYDLMVIPKQVGVIDTLEFCHLIDITIEDFIEKFSVAKKYSRYKPSVFQNQLSAETFARFQEKLFKFSGFFVYKRSLRKYPDKIASNLLGYVSEVSANDIQSDSYYSIGDNIGSSGIEKAYELDLRGRKGIKVFMVDVFNRVKGSFGDGKYDTLSLPGLNLTCTIDADLQKYGERLMTNKKGSIVAIEPATGEVLAMISSPTYDPNLLVGRVRSANYNILNKDTLYPLFNRALMAQYPPGSIFKLIQALTGLKKKVVGPHTSFPCDKTLINCHDHISPLNLDGSIQHSCNPYYYLLFKRIINNQLVSNNGTVKKGYDDWFDIVRSFGIGEKLGIDIATEKSGNLPTSGYFDRVYGENRWRFETIYSLGIGQGEILTVPIQMANLAVILANRGHYYTPHLISRNWDLKWVKRTSVDPSHFDLVVNAMEDVVEKGTGRQAKLRDITVCGKTGTAQNPHGEDHSIFIAFSPKENPQIAISVIVENSGFGGTWAAPIASLMIEKYATGSVSDTIKEKRMLEADFLTIK